MFILRRITDCSIINTEIGKSYSKVMDHPRKKGEQDSFTNAWEMFFGEKYDEEKRYSHSSNENENDIDKEYIKGFIMTGDSIYPYHTREKSYIMYSNG